MLTDVTAICNGIGCNGATETLTSNYRTHANRWPLWIFLSQIAYLLHGRKQKKENDETTINGENWPTKNGNAEEINELPFIQRATGDDSGDKSGDMYRMKAHTHSVQTLGYLPHYAIS